MLLWYSLTWPIWLLCLSSMVFADLNLTVIHNNDFHTRYLPINTNNYAQCEPNNANWDKCVGGVARTVAQMKFYRETVPNLLFLNAGDHFQGTFWFTIKKSEVVAEFVSRMKHDAMAVGNHEFDDGPEELRKFIDKMSNMNADMPLLSCNIEFDSASVLYGKVQRSIIKVIDGVPVAIIGYTTPDTVFMSRPGDLLKFRDEIEAINEEIDRIKKTNADLNIFIAVGHSGFERDKQIGQAIPDLDLIVGGHTNTFLYTGTNVPSIEKPEGDYPVVINHTSTGTQTLIVQAFAYGKYLGKLNLLFDQAGNVKQFSGEPIYLNSSYLQDNETEQLVLKMNDQLNEQFNQTIGFTDVDLDAETCRFQECNLGNLIADSYADLFKELALNDSMVYPTECNNTMALVNGGDIRSGINQGPISYKSIMSTLPFGNSLGLFTATGNELLQTMQHSANQYQKGGFMQMSRGLRVTYEHTTNNEKVELKQLLVNCNNQWKPVDPNGTYLVVISDFIANGGDNYTIDESHFIDYQFDDAETLIRYVLQLQNVSVAMDGRIEFVPNAAANQTLAINVILLAVMLYFTNVQMYKVF